MASIGAAHRAYNPSILFIQSSFWLRRLIDLWISAAQFLPSLGKAQITFTSTHFGETA